MTVEYMTPVNINRYSASRKDDIGWEYDSGDVASPSNGNPVLIPDNVKVVSTTLEVNTGEGKLQATTNKVANVESDTDVVWVDWDAGSVTVTTQDACSPVTAIRMVNVSGTTRLMMRAQ